MLAGVLLEFCSAVIKGSSSAGYSSSVLSLLLSEANISTMFNTELTIRAIANAVASHAMYKYI